MIKAASGGEHPFDRQYYSRPMAETMTGVTDR
jgi:hypothetical protein